MDVTDPSTWLPLDGLEPGFDAYKGQPSTALAGRELEVALDGGDRTGYRFDDPATLRWTVHEGAHAGRSGMSGYEALEVAAGLYLVVLEPGDQPRTAVALTLDLDAGRAFSAVTTVGPVTPGRPACIQDLRAGVVDGGTPAGDPPAPTLDLVGRRVLWEYSDDHAYEHAYLNGDLYTWHCLAGPERGLADTDPCTVWRLRPDVYAVTWREKVVPCAATVVCDYTRMRSHGMLFGLDRSGQDTVRFTFAARGTVLGVTEHPGHLDPRTRPAGR